MSIVETAILEPGWSVAAPSQTPVRTWLWLMAALVFAMVVVGGATRLTESGLSITEWNLVTGVLPPLSQAAWVAEFEKYKRIPQFAQLFPDMDLARFQSIYFWEWGHRLLGRVIGFAFALPLIFFWWQGRIGRGLALRLCAVLALGGLQGAVGWWMVRSGLTARVEVAQERLAVHLVLASLTFAAIVWIATGLPRDSAFSAKSRPLRNFSSRAGGLRAGAALIVGLLFVQIGFGALVAGLRAGLVNNDWPLFEGRFLPPRADLFSLSPWWSNMLDNVLTVQVQHRLLAYIVLAVALGHAWFALRRVAGTAAARRAAVVAALIATQAVIGVVTLVLVVPLWAGLLHQSFAMLALGMAVVHWRLLAQPAVVSSA